MSADDANIASSDAQSGTRDVLVYITSWCGTCRMAVEWLGGAGASYRQIDIEQDDEAARRGCH
jgi:hypothetical protein